MSSELELSESARGVSFGVDVKVRASRTSVLGVKSARLGVALTAPPVDGAANEALRAALSDYFDVPKSRVQIIAGERSRKKRVELAGVSAAAVRSRLAGSG